MMIIRIKYLLLDEKQKNWYVSHMTSTFSIFTNDKNNMTYEINKDVKYPFTLVLYIAWIIPTKISFYLTAK
jgi:hypothetical protein